MRVTTYRPIGLEAPCLRPLTAAEGVWPDVPDPAGGPEVTRPERANPMAFFEQLRRWGFNLSLLSDPDGQQALWSVLLRQPERRKMTRALRGPHYHRREGVRGFRIRVFGAAGQAADYRRVQDFVVEGPVYRLTYADAGRLWRDRDMLVTPTRDRIVAPVAPGGPR